MRFTLNGAAVKLNGTCNHHDLGALGAAVNTRAIERRMQQLKAMGVNALRTFPGSGTVIFGARTLVTANLAFQQWRYLSVRRQRANSRSQCRSAAALS